MEIFGGLGDVIVVGEATARPRMPPGEQSYVPWWEEPRETKRRPASPHRVRQAVARVLFALANALAVPEQQETVSA